MLIKTGRLVHLKAKNRNISILIEGTEEALTVARWQELQRT
jgi:hypothetical protein